MPFGAAPAEPPPLPVSRVPYQRCDGECRLSTVRQASRIVVVQAGRVVEQGSHSQLMRLTRGIYRGMVQKAEMRGAESVDGSDDDEEADGGMCGGV